MSLKHLLTKLKTPPPAAKECNSLYLKDNLGYLIANLIYQEILYDGRVEYYLVKDALSFSTFPHLLDYLKKTYPATDKIYHDPLNGKPLKEIQS